MKKITLLTACVLFTGQAVMAQEQGKPEDTEYWTPVPKKINSGKLPGEAPSDAIILFNGKDLNEWSSMENKTAEWPVKNGLFTVNKKAGDIKTKRVFTDYQLHLEWLIPADIDQEGQSRGNSGLFLAGDVGGEGGGYELQILDNYENKTYVNGQSGSVYKQNPPLVNACKKPGEWQTYDVIWKAPRFTADGSLLSPASITVLQNGVLVQNAFELPGKTLYIGKPYYQAHGAQPIKLQSHGDPSKPISFRNIWVREL